MRSSRQHVRLIPGIDVDVRAAEHQHGGNKIRPAPPFNIGELIEDVAALERVQHADHGDVRGVEILLEVSDLVWIRGRGG